MSASSSESLFNMHIAAMTYLIASTCDSTLSFISAINELINTDIITSLNGMIFLFTFPFLSLLAYKKCDMFLFLKVQIKYVLINGYLNTVGRTDICTLLNNNMCEVSL